MKTFLYCCRFPLPVFLRIEAENEDDAFYEAVMRGPGFPRLYGYIENPRRGSVTRA